MLLWTMISFVLFLTGGSWFKEEEHYQSLEHLIGQKM